MGVPAVNTRSHTRTHTHAHTHTHPYTPLATHAHTHTLIPPSPLYFLTLEFIVFRNAAAAAAGAEKNPVLVWVQ